MVYPIQCSIVRDCVVVKAWWKVAVVTHYTEVLAVIEASTVQVCTLGRPLCCPPFVESVHPWMRDRPLLVTLRQDFEVSKMPLTKHCSLIAILFEDLCHSDFRCG